LGASQFNLYVAFPWKEKLKLELFTLNAVCTWQLEDSDVA